MPLTPEECTRLDELEAAFARAGGRGVDVADEIDALRRLGELPYRPEGINRRLQAEYPVYRAVNERIALWSLLLATLIVRAEYAQAALIAVDESDQDDSGSLVGVGVLDSEGQTLDEDLGSGGDDLWDVLSNLDQTNQHVWSQFRVSDERGRHWRLDVQRILDTIVPTAVEAVTPESKAEAGE
jgi:hypothetical protein